MELCLGHTSLGGQMIVVHCACLIRRCTLPLLIHDCQIVLCSRLSLVGCRDKQIERLIEIEWHTLAERVPQSQSELGIWLSLLGCLPIPSHRLLVVGLILLTVGEDVSQLRHCRNTAEVCRLFIVVNRPSDVSGRAVGRMQVKRREIQCSRDYVLVRGCCEPTYGLLVINLRDILASPVNQ